MNIGQAAKASGVSQRMIRHYEAIGLIPSAARTEAGYRVYSDADVHTLRFIGRARDLGFPLPDIELLVRLWHDRSRGSAEVKALAQTHMATLDRKIAELQSMRRTLEHLSATCHGDKRPDCPILDGLAGGAGDVTGFVPGRRRRAVLSGRP